MRTRAGITTLAIGVGLFALACEQATTSPPEPAFEAPSFAMHSQAASKSVVTVTADDFSGNFGTSTLIRHPSNGSFSWRFTASGLTPGNAFTIWVFPGPPDLGASGVVGGSGTVSVAGNNCLYPVPGKTAGSKPDCGLRDPNGAISIRLRDHGAKIPGNSEQTRLVNGGCNPTCANVRRADHPAAP